MRQASYLQASRHGIFYFRWPIPSALHPKALRSDVKVSLGTRCPRAATRLSRLLSVAGHLVLRQASIRRMRYEEIRSHVAEHFRSLLTQFKADIAEDGPVDTGKLDALRAAQGLAGGDPHTWASLTHPEGTDGLLSAFCGLRGIAEQDLSQGDRERILAELGNGHAAYASAALNYSESLKGYDLSDQTRALQSSEVNGAPEDGPGYAEIVERYFKEMQRGGSLAAKTEHEKRDALQLLGEIAEQTPPARLTKADAQKVKDVLLRLPKNRSKTARTRGKTLSEMLELKGVEVISARTANAYISAMQTFCRWAVNNGYAEGNVFDGMRVRLSKKAKDQAREAFTSEQLQTLFTQLTENPNERVNKDEHKWGTLIGMFTGMRLNEVAQLEVSDIQCRDGVWCIEVTEDGDDNKRLKNASSQRLVPVHDRLASCGFLSFVEKQRSSGATRLFPMLSYSAQNGYGRNIGRWFNERFLPELGMKHPGLVFHSLRHTMVTKLSQSDVPDVQVKAIVGHAQAGVTYANYFKAGFLPAQLKAAIERFDF